MAKKAKKEQATIPAPAQNEVKSELGIQVKLDKDPTGRLTVTVSLTKDGQVIATDYDFVKV